MSLTLSTIAVVGAIMAPSKPVDPEYLIGCDVLGAGDPPASSPVVEVHTSSYWTSVAAGLTVAAILGVFGYSLQRSAL